MSLLLPQQIIIIYPQRLSQQIFYNTLRMNSQLQLPKPKVSKSAELSNFFELKTKLTMAIVKNRQKITVYPTYNHTFLFEDSISSFSKCRLYHLKEDGEIIKGLQSYIYELYLISEYEVIFSYFETQSFNVKQWNLKTNQVTELKIKKQFGKLSNQFFFLFPETKLFCAVQQLKSENKTKPMLIKVQYYNYPLKSKEDKPIKTFKSENHEVKSSYQPSKLNNHSGIVWKYLNSLYTPMSATCIHVFDLRHGEGKQFQTFKFDHFFNKDTELDTSVYQIWQPQYGLIYINCGVYVAQRALKAFQKNVQKLQKLKKKAKCLHYIWDYRNNKFTLLKIDGNSEVQFVNGFRKVQRFQIVKRQQVKKNQQKNKKFHGYIQRVIYTRKTICYFDLQSFEVLFSEPTPDRNYSDQQKNLTKFIYPAYDIQTYHQVTQKINLSCLNQKETMEIVSRRYLPFLFCMHFVAVFFMEQTVNMTDQDLLLYIVQMLDNKNQLQSQGWSAYKGQENERKELQMRTQQIMQNSEQFLEQLSEQFVERNHNV